MVDGEAEAVRWRLPVFERRHVVGAEAWRLLVAELVLEYPRLDARVESSQKLGEPDTLASFPMQGCQAQEVAPRSVPPTPGGENRRPEARSRCPRRSRRTGC